MNKNQNSILKSNETVASVIRRQKIAAVVKHIFLYIFWAMVAVFIVFPFYWMIITSLKSEGEINSINITYFPKQIMFKNYPLAIQTAKMGRLMFNTIFMVIAFIATFVSW